jgi:hypothetical protein
MMPDSVAHNAVPITQCHTQTITSESGNPVAFDVASATRSRNRTVSSCGTVPLISFSTQSTRGGNNSRNEAAANAPEYSLIAFTASVHSHAHSAPLADPEYCYG